jgi:hypothetical protein
VAVPVYSKQFEIAHASALGKDIQPPAGTIWVVVQILVYSGNTASTDLSWSFTEHYSGATVVFLPFPDLKIGLLFFNGRLVINEDQRFNATTSSSIGSDLCDWYIGGFELTLP